MVDYGEDMFQRIVGVHWPKKEAHISVFGGLGVFAMGDVGGFACYIGGAKVEDASGLLVPRTIFELGTMGFGESGAIYGSSCHVFPDGAVYVLCGLKDFAGGPGDDGIIMASTDGLIWSTVYTVPSERGAMVDDSSQVFAVVWDGDGFWAAVHRSRQTTATRDAGPGHDPIGFLAESREYDILLRSSDGFGWSVAGQNSFVTFTNSDGFSPISYGTPPWNENGLLAPHCRDGVPDGFSHYSLNPDTGAEINVRTDAVVVPDYSGGSIDVDQGSVVLIDIKTGGIKTLSRESSPGFPLYAVSYSGGIVVAVGGDPVTDTPEGTGPSSYAVSYDLGKSWISGAYSGRPPAMTVCG